MRALSVFKKNVSRKRFARRLLVLVIASVLWLLILGRIPSMYRESPSLQRKVTDESKTYDPLLAQQITLDQKIGNFRNKVFRTFEFVNFMGNQAIPSGFNQDEPCNYNSKASLEYSNSTVPIIPNYTVFSESINHPKSRLYKFLQELTNGKPIDTTFAKKWFMFGSSAEWLEEEQCYVSYSRLIISDWDTRTRASVSLIAAQAFDKDWNELYNKRIKYVDIETPEDFDEQLKAINAKYNIVEECLGREEDGGYTKSDINSEGTSKCTN